MAMHQIYCRNCGREAIPGLRYCMDCEPIVQRILQQDRDRLDEQIERMELERMYRN